MYIYMNIILSDTDLKSLSETSQLKNFNLNQLSKNN